MPQLHSFPTRRSSDLGLVCQPLRLARGSVICIYHGIVVLGKCKLQDRKSTRLNSSHVEISYAVFCLKKKRTSHYRRGVTDNHGRLRRALVNPITTDLR